MGLQQRLPCTEDSPAGACSGGAKSTAAENPASSEPLRAVTETLPSMRPKESIMSGRRSICKELLRKAGGRTIIPALKTASTIVSQTAHKTVPKHDRSEGSHATKRHAREGAANEDIQRLHSPWQCAPSSMATENARYLYTQREG